MQYRSIGIVKFALVKGGPPYLWCYDIVYILQCYIITDKDLDDDKIDDGDVDAFKVDNAPNANDIDDLLLFGSDQSRTTVPEQDNDL